MNTSLAFNRDRGAKLIWCKHATKHGHGIEDLVSVAVVDADHDYDDHDHDDGLNIWT